MDLPPLIIFFSCVDVLSLSACGEFFPQITLISGVIKHHHLEDPVFFVS